MTDMTPRTLLDNLGSLSRRLDDAQADLAKAEDEAARSKHAADLTDAKAFLAAEGAVEVRKRKAFVETETHHLTAAVAEAGVKAARSALAVLRTKIDVGRTLVSAAKSEQQASGWTT